MNSAHDSLALRAATARAMTGWASDRRRCASIAPAALIALLLAPVAARGQAVVQADGSGSVFPLLESVAREFQVVQRGGVRVAVQVSGTRGGFRRFCAGQTDLQNASRPIVDEEIEACRRGGVPFIELPVALDAVAIVVHPENSWIHEISTQQLAQLWDRRAEGRLLSWRQLDASFPARPITLFGPGPDSGTRDFFVDAVLGPSGAIRRDYAGGEDDDAIAAAIARQPGAIGFLPLGYALRHARGLRVLPVAHRGAAAVAPSPENIALSRYLPLSRPLFVYVAEDSLQRTEVMRFVEFFLSDARRLVTAAAFMPLSEETYDAARERVRVRLSRAVPGHEAGPALPVDKVSWPVAAD